MNRKEWKERLFFLSSMAGKKGEGWAEFVAQFQGTADFKTAKTYFDVPFIETTLYKGWFKGNESFGPIYLLEIPHQREASLTMWDTPKELINWAANCAADDDQWDYDNEPVETLFVVEQYVGRDLYSFKALTESEAGRLAETYKGHQDVLVKALLEIELDGEASPQNSIGLKCRSSIQGNGVTAPWVYFSAPTIRSAKAKASQEWGAGFLHHTIILEILPKGEENWGFSDRYYRPIGGRSWSD